MPSPLTYLTEGTRIFLNGMKRRVKHDTYEGNAKEICLQIVAECWNGQYFQTSVNNFPQFWTRDFGWCAESLTKLGFEKEVHKTITYALSIFSRYKKTFTTITPSGKPYDFPNESVDSLPWLIHAIAVSNYNFEPYTYFLEKEISRYMNQIIDRTSGLVRSDKQFSSMKDFSIRESSCYDNSMIALLKKDLQVLKLKNPFKWDYQELLIKTFWNGMYFYDDLNHTHYLAGDAQVFPFLTINDSEKLKLVIHHIKENNLDQPFPLKYTKKRTKYIPQEIFLRNYESHAIWTHMGPIYMKLVKEVNPQLFTFYHQQYTQMIEKHKNYLEVFTKDGKPYQSPFYYCDSGMLWAANYLTL